MTQDNTLAPYAKYLINQPCIFGYQEAGTIIGCEGDEILVHRNNREDWQPRNEWTKAHTVIVSLLQYDQLTDEQWWKLFNAGDYMQKMTAYHRWVAEAEKSIAEGIIRWTSDQMDLLDEWGVDRHDLIGKNLAERREICEHYY